MKCDELKAHRIIGLDERCNSVDNDYYLKSEADKVIAEKDGVIDELEEYIDELQKATDSAWSKFNVYYDELRHSNLKRCLAMAKWCDESEQGFELLGNVEYDAKCRSHLYFVSNNRKKWHKRWLKIAEQFKEAK